MSQYRHIDISSIDPKEVARVNLELTQQRYSRETNPELRSFLRKRIQALKSAMTFNLYNHLQNHPINQN